MNNVLSYKITEIDGRNLYYSFLAGTKNLFDNQKRLNMLNLFPVPDADTGSNLASTFQAIIDNVIPTSHIKQTSVAIADAALVGARGNSGIIVAQFLYGFSNEMANVEKISVESFAQHLQKAVEYAYQAIANPMEGTIITVMKDWAQQIYDLKDKTDDFVELIMASFQRALESLEQTALRMEVLAKTKIVDAGAQGFVYFLEGMNTFFKERSLRNILVSRNIVKVDEMYDNHDEITYRYCTEALISNVKISKEKLVKKIEHLGDSLVVAGSTGKMRVHIHTDQPADVFTQLSREASIASQKVDDMVLQYHISHHRKYGIGLLVDSCADLPGNWMDEHQISMIPLNLHMGESQFLDKLTMSSDSFYHYMDSKTNYPRTSQPSLKDTYNKLNYLSSHYDSLVVLNLSSRASGTYDNCSKAAEKVASETGKHISVVDSKTLSGTQGLMALRAARAIAAGASHEQVVAELERWKNVNRLLVGVKTLKYLVRGGRISPMKGLIANALNLKPIISIDDTGKPFNFGKAFSRKANLKKIIRMSEAFIAQHGLYGYCVLYTNKEERKEALAFARELEQVLGRAPEYIMPVSTVLGANGGIGSIAVALLGE